MIKPRDTSIDDRLLLDVTRPGLWHVVETHDKFERIVRDGLRRKGFNIYLPMIPVQRRHARRTIERMEPVLLGYLFVQFDRATQELDPIINHIGVARLVSFDRSEPAVVPLDELDRLDRKVQAMRAEFEDRRRGKANHLFKSGDQVRVKDGMWMGFIALLDKVKGDELQLRLDIFGRSTKVEINAARVELAAAS